MAEIAAMGSWGACPSNVHQQLTNTYLRYNSFPVPGVVKVSGKDRRANEVVSLPCSILLPHEMFSAMFRSSPDEFHQLFGIEALDEFWLGASR